MIGRNIFRARSSRKVFCIGLNKTGTTTLEQVFRDFGYKVDKQSKAHQLMYQYEERNFSAIIDHCRNSEFFQDSPFSMKYTYMFLQDAFPESKFILTLRDDAEEWYSSLVRFHTKKFSQNKLRPPTSEELKLARRPGGRTVYDNLKMRFNTPDEDIYKKEILLNYYNSHLDEVDDFFRPIQDRLLKLNIKDHGSYLKLCDYLGEKPLYEDFPWLNKT
jgi:hypothetical protein